MVIEGKTKFVAATDSLHIPQELQAWIVTKAPWEDHALLCLFGTNMLVLTSMTTDNLIMARHAWGQTCRHPIIS